MILSGPELLRLQAVQDALLQIETEVKDHLKEQAERIEHDLTIARIVMRGESPELDELASQRFQQMQQAIHERHPRLNERLTTTAEATARLGPLYKIAGLHHPHFPPGASRAFFVPLFCSLSYAPKDGTLFS